MARAAAPEWVIDERRDLAEVLDALGPEQWDAPTLCAGWRVREVVAHITMAFRYPLPRFVWGMVKAGGRFDVMADRSARADTEALSDEELLACLTANLAHPWKPPGGGFEGALSHDMIHGLDITTALGVDRTVPADRLSRVLDGMSPRNVGYFHADIADVRLEATDRDWTFGAGTPVRGRAQHLLLVICGRTLPEGLLTGDAADRFLAPVGS
ncbi:maleylpyruvate isomerase family mycothiol-dependent enzyme [Rhodococcus triatomae]|uniref:TIGR03083 family protein n=1 Tax=Rhodococcus triatomae TaxID=300028 RepID=A0A1G8HMY7_9NOCA|nr:maleylpyruvate isomerase family mycothiol-dependent enzyme [Rhodococcus triatomae]QNG20824.1 maleylpyruvate isomerase family mycothiol-dependent enzyme [Rhodococcus triatomae]QNG23261.1 maleylpyruvate isomerase family mycothiol-dependent enzyme [Rhodococcus triatomae]SDI07800.1 TIGR03083 family protein [Rhodococcus triatomae]